MSSQQDINLRGATIEAPDNPGSWIGKMMRARISAALTCLLNPRILVPVDTGNGITVLQEARIVMGPNGWTAILPASTGLFAAGDTGGGSTPGIGGSYQSTWNPANAYGKGAIVRVTAAINYASNTPGNPIVASTVGVFGCITGTQPQGGAFVDPNQIPQFPEPSSRGILGPYYWECMGLGFQAISVCAGANKTIYIQSSVPF